MFSLYLHTIEASIKFYLIEILILAGSICLEILKIWSVYTLNKVQQTKWGFKSNEHFITLLRSLLQHFNLKMQLSNMIDRLYRCQLFKIILNI